MGAIARLRVLLALLLTLVPLGGALAAPPNIVVILADDMGWGDLRANNRASLVATPNLDRLAREGMRFRNAHSSAAVCAPTRYGLLTGNYQWRGARAWGTWKYWFSSQILPGQLTIGDLAQRAGYRTGFVGKLHMGGDFYGLGSDEVTREQSLVDFSRGFANGPLAHGFDYSFPLLDGIQGEPYAYFENDRLVGDPALLQVWAAGRYGSSEILKDGRGMPDWDSSQVGPELLDRALGFIDRHLAGPDAARPFLLYYSAQAVHEPHTPPAKLAGKKIAGFTGLCARQDMIRELDVAVGALTAHLREKGLLADTLFLFTSDNGGEDLCGQDSSGPTFAGEKSQILEGGHRVPMIVKWGDTGNYTVPPGTARNQLISTLDVVATLARLAGSEVGADQALDSFDFSEVWLGTRSDRSPVRDHLMAESRNADVDTAIPSTIAYYEGSWKLVLQRRGGVYRVVRLADLTADPGETIDLATDPALATRVGAMRDRFLARRFAARTAP